MNRISIAASLLALMALPALAQDATPPNPDQPAPTEKVAPPSPSTGPESGPAATEPAPAPTPNAMAPDESAGKSAATENKMPSLGSEIAASDLLNQKVKNPANEIVGDINDLSIGSDGKIAAVIIGVGGFLGMGEKNVSLPYDELTFSRDAGGFLVVTANITTESLQSAPEWKKPSGS